MSAIDEAVLTRTSKVRLVFDVAIRQDEEGFYVDVGGTTRLIAKGLPELMVKMTEYIQKHVFW